MIRGISSTVSPGDLVAGAFYLLPRNGGDPWLVQIVLDDRASSQQNPVKQNPVKYALVLDPENVKDPISLTEFATSMPCVLMPEVSIRVDPPSMMGNAFTTSIARGMFIVCNQRPYVVAATSYFGYAIVDMLDGKIVRGFEVSDPWIAFDRWQLVIDEAGEEVPIASFGARINA